MRRGSGILGTSLNQLSLGNIMRKRMMMMLMMMMLMML